MGKLKEIFTPDPEMMQRMWGGVSRRTLWMWRVVALFVLFLFLGAGYYLYTQVKQDRIRAEEKRVEISRRKEAARRQAAYRQMMEQHQKQPRAKHTLFGE